MTHDAKAASAGSTSGRGSRLDSTRPGALGTRASSPASQGTSTPSHRPRHFAAALTIAALALLALAPLSQAKYVVTGFGTNTGGSNLGGQFATSPFSGSGTAPRGIAVNSSGNGAPAGTSYVVDGYGSRIQRFGPQGTFDLTWGQNVFGRDERQLIAPTPSFTEPGTLGSIKLTFAGDTTSPITVIAASNGEVRANTLIAELTALPSIGAGNISVSGSFDGGYKVRFVGALGGTDVPQITVDSSELNVVTVSASTLENGAGGSFAGFEICSEAQLCKEGETTGITANGGQLNNPQGVAVNQANGHVYVTESGNSRVSEFDADGNFIRAFGWDVVKTGGAGDVSTNAFEVCTVAADCKQGAAGANGGEFGTSIGYPVTDPSNNVWVPDAANRRIQEFTSTGAFIAAYGYNVDALGGGGALEKCTSTAAGACQAGTSGTLPGQFANSNPGQIAFDSAGNLYAIDFAFSDSAHQRVLKFDPTLSTASVFGASIFASYTTKGPESITSTQGGTRLDFALTNNVSGGGEVQILELNPNDASVTDTSLVGSGLTDIAGLGADSSSDKLFATTDSIRAPRGVLVLRDTPPASPAVAVDAPSALTDTTATFSGTVDPNGGFVDGCKFQYSTDLNTWIDVPLPVCPSLDPTGGPQPVTANVTGLDPNTQYFVRLQAARPLVPNSSVVTSAAPFDTVAPPPVISNLGAIQIQDTSARLVATIDPRNTATGYVFQYGTTPALGSATAPLNVGSGTTPITVSQLVTGLDKNTTYYFRAVATNLIGTSTSTSKTFQTRTVPFPPAGPGNCANQALRAAQGAGALGDCRAWEQVSPVDKNGGNAVGQIGGAPYVSPATDGNAVGYCTGAPLFGDPVGQMTLQCAPYISRREAGGWRLTTPFPRYCRTETLTGSYAVPQWSWLDADMRHAVVWHPENANCLPPLDPAAPLVKSRFAMNLYREDLGADPASSTYDLLAPRLDPGQAAGGGEAIVTGQFAAADPSFDHIFINSNVNQTDPPDSPPQNEFGKVYEWTREGVSGCATTGGCLSLFSVDPAGQPFQSGAGIPGHNNLDLSAEETAPHPVSDDGERAFLVHTDHSTGYGLQGCPGAQAFGEGTQPCELYMRAHNGEPGAVTYDVSASERTVPDPNGDTPAFLQRGTTTGTVGFFASCEKLTDDSTAFTAPPLTPRDPVCDSSEGEDLYRWSETPDGSGHHLTDISVDHEPADGTTAHYMYMLGASDGGDVAYFATTGQILAGADTTAVQFSSTSHDASDLTANAKLYRWSWNDGNPTTEFLGLYDPLKRDNSGDLNRSARAVTPNGNSLTITTDQALDPAADTDADADVYRWDQQAGWTCLSCQLPGTPSAGDSGLPVAPRLNGSPSDLKGTGNDAYGTPTVASDDGSRVFFNSADALLPEDTNGAAGCPDVNTTGGTLPACLDVYEWHDGTLSLISSGTGADPSALIGTTGSGKDVFFWTSNRLVGWDKDNGVDIYDARSDGGFPEPATTTPCDLNAGACRGAGSGTPSIPGAGTPNFQGPDNPLIHRKHHKPKKHKKHHKRHAKRHHHRHRAANHNRRAGR